MITEEKARFKVKLFINHSDKNHSNRSQNIEDRFPSNVRTAKLNNYFPHDGDENNCKDKVFHCLAQQENEEPKTHTGLV